MEARKMKIMIVDDEADFTRLIKTNLESIGGYEVCTANRAREAVPLAKIFNPDFILLDVLMPDGGGGEIASDLAKLPETRSVPVAFLTAAIKQAELGAPEGVVGGKHFIAKPVTMNDLIFHIQRRLAEKNLGKS
jgi:CheY-like chemotaxis protein